jgi:hypothetical protein
MISFLPVKGTGRGDAGRRPRGRWSWTGVVGAILLLALGCEDNSTTGPRSNGLTIEDQELIEGGAACRLRVTISNRTGSDLSGQLAYQLLNAQKVVIGTAVVFPTVPDGTRRTATSDFLRASSDGHPLACAEIVAVQLAPVGSTVPLASI